MNLYNQPLLIKPDVAREAFSAYVPQKQAFFFMSGDGEKKFKKQGNIGIISITGVVSQRANWLTSFFGGAATEAIKTQIEKAINDASIDKIVLDIDSPGGTVDGVQELSSFIFAAREKKEIIAIANPLAASAAYWIASSASKIYLASDTAEVGSIGVIAVHQDFSKMDEKFGVKITEITSAPMKNALSPNRPLSQVGQEELQKSVTAVHEIFVEDVARNLNRTPEDVQDNIASGAVFMGKDAVAKGLATGVLSIDQLTFSGVQEVDEKDKKQAAASPPATTITAALIEKEHSTVYAEIFDAGKKAGMDAGLEAGAKAERERIQGIEDTTPEGFEAMANDVKFDGKTTAADVALMVTKKMKEDGITLAALKQESKSADFSGAGRGDDDMSAEKMAEMIAGGQK